MKEMPREGVRNVLFLCGWWLRPCRGACGARLTRHCSGGTGSSPLFYAWRPPGHAGLVELARCGEAARERRTRVRILASVGSSNRGGGAETKGWAPRPYPEHRRCPPGSGEAEGHLAG